MDQVKSFFIPFFTTNNEGFEGRYGIKQATIEAVIAYAAHRLAGMNPSFLLITCSAGTGAISEQLVRPVLKKCLIAYMDMQTSHVLVWAINNTLHTALMRKLNQRIGRTFDQFILFMGIYAVAAPITHAAFLAVDKLGTYLLSKTEQGRANMRRPTQHT